MRILTAAILNNSTEVVDSVDKMSNKTDISTQIRLVSVLQAVISGNIDTKIEETIMLCKKAGQFYSFDKMPGHLFSKRDKSDENAIISSGLA